MVAPEKSTALSKVILLIAIAAAVALFAACCRSLTEIVKEAQTQVVTDHVADVIHGKSVAVDLEYYEDPKYYDTLKVGDVYQYGRVVDSVYVERKYMKKKVEGRGIPLHQEAKDALIGWIKELEKLGKSEPSGPLFRSRKGHRAIARVQAFRILKDVYEANGLSGKLGTHAMRKTFADRIYERLGRDLIRVQRAMGHKAITSTVSYLSLREEEITEAILSI